MKDTFTSLLTLLVMVIGLALIIGGPRAVRFLFAPFLFCIRQSIRVLFVALVVIVLVAAAMSAKRSSTNQPADSAASPALNGVEAVGQLKGEGN